MRLVYQFRCVFKEGKKKKKKHFEMGRLNNE